MLFLGTAIALAAGSVAFIPALAMNQSTILSSTIMVEINSDGSLPLLN
jgi:hypothetical protein